MPGIIPDATLNELLSTTQVNEAAWRIMLFKNNYTPVPGTAFASLTEADFSGYARQTPTFGVPSVAANISTSVGSQVTFTHNGGATPNDIYGYALLDTTPGTPLVLFADRLTSPPTTLSANGDSLKVTINETLQQA